MSFVGYVFVNLLSLRSFRGRMIATGTPEEVARIRKSFTPARP